MAADDGVIALLAELTECLCEELLLNCTKGQVAEEAERAYGAVTRSAALLLSHEGALANYTLEVMGEGASTVHGRLRLLH
jgi:hypothetical protein